MRIVKAHRKVGAAIMAEIFYKKQIPIVDKIERKLFETVNTNDYVKADGNKGLIEVRRRFKA